MVRCSVSVTGTPSMSCPTSTMVCWPGVMRLEQQVEAVDDTEQVLLRDAGIEGDHGGIGLEPENVGREEPIAQWVLMFTPSSVTTNPVTLSNSG